MKGDADEGVLGEILAKYRAGDLAAAAALVDARLSQREEPDVLHLAAVIALRQNRPDAAENFARRAVALQDSNVAYRFTLAQILTTQRRSDEAIAELRAILRMAPGFHAAHVQIWNIMKTLGRRHELTALVKDRLAALEAVAPVRPLASKVPIPDTTLCCIDCTGHPAAARALRASMAGCAFLRVVLFTDRKSSLDGIETVVIEPVRSLEEYSRFVMKGLYHQIDTRFVMIVQWDGYVTHPPAWSAEFQSVDYIGARLPFLPAGRASGNGGFSLRSRRLLEVLQAPRFTVTHPEDLAICHTYRDELEREFGIRFASDELADRFAFELAEPAGVTFGFHGPRNITRFIDDEAIRLLQSP